VQSGFICETGTSPNTVRVIHMIINSKLIKL